MRVAAAVAWCLVGVCGALVQPQRVRGGPFAERGARCAPMLAEPEEPPAAPPSPAALSSVQRMPPLVSRKNVVRGVSVLGYACVLCAISKADETPAYVQHVQSTISAAVAGVARPRVLEVGIGDAVNIKNYPRGTRLVGLDATLPSKEEQKEIVNRARDEHGVELFWVQGDVAKMPFDAGLFDAVVATKVLCSVVDPQTCVSEISRVLRKGGRFGYVEHVAADPGSLLEKSQLLLDPAQQALAGGCHLHRETDAMLRESVAAGLFDELEAAERYVALLMWPIAQQATGVLRR